MTKEEVVTLSDLARIALSKDEIDRLPNEISTILDYVSVVQDIAKSDGDELTISGHSNVFRKDEVRHEPGAQTEILLQAAPRRKDNFVVVNKILQQDE